MTVLGQSHHMCCHSFSCASADGTRSTGCSKGSYIVHCKNLQFAVMVLAAGRQQQSRLSQIYQNSTAWLPTSTSLLRLLRSQQGIVLIADIVDSRSAAIRP